MDGQDVNLTPARALALKALAEIRSRDAWAHSVLDSMLGNSDLSASDRALATRLVYGTVQTMGTLDEALDRFIPRPAGVQPLVRDAMRVAAWELLFGDGDAHAAVHQSVEAVARYAPHAKGFANAVLRKLADAASTFPWGDPDCDDAVLARLHGHPEWLVERLLAEYDRDVVAGILAANNSAAPLYVAHNPFKGELGPLMDALEQDGAAPQAAPVPGSILCGNAARAVRGKAVADGRCLVVDAAAQLVARLASTDNEGMVVDLAAGRGTKTVLIQAASGGTALLLAVDVHEFKTAILLKRMIELGVPHVSAVTADATDPEALQEVLGGSVADVVLVDAPCSGLGALRRTPEKRWSIEPNILDSLAALGSKLLFAAARLVRPGGVVVYSTCTILGIENRDVVEGFLVSQEGSLFQRVALTHSVPEAWGGFVREDGDFQSLPAKGGPDGHYAAVLRSTQSN